MAASAVTDPSPISTPGTSAPGAGAAEAAALSVVLCGSFRRDVAGLRKTFEALHRSYVLLAPVSTDFFDADVEFVRLRHEIDESVDDIEARHLHAILQVDFVWLFCPDGYVGTSAALEVGYAHAAGVPVLTDREPTDPVLAGMVTLVDDIAIARDVVVARPGQGLAALQDYYRRIARRRGWANETARDTLLLLTEELGELARAVRKSSGIGRDGLYPDTDVAAELADVQLYLVHLANNLGVNLAEAVTRKEVVNAERQSRRSSAA